MEKEMKYSSLSGSIGIMLLLVSGYATGSTGPYVSTIKKLQVNNIGNPYHTVHLTLDITDSPCSSTNEHNRFAILNAEQHSTILAALMAGKQITIYGRGTCNDADIEEISEIRLSP
jgi:hypothetical protein